MGTGGGGKLARRCATVASLKKLEKVPRERAGGGTQGERGEGRKLPAESRKRDESGRALVTSRRVHEIITRLPSFAVVFLSLAPSRSRIHAAAFKRLSSFG